MTKDWDEYSRNRRCVHHSLVPVAEFKQGTAWVPSSGRLLEFSLDPTRCIEKACEFVGPDLTREE